VHLLLKNYGSSEPKPSATVTEIPEAEEAETEAPTEENSRGTSEIIPLATRTKEGMAALVKVLKGLPGRRTGSFTVHAASLCGLPPLKFACLMLPWARV
jgi:hypothetical protein